MYITCNYILCTNTAFAGKNAVHELTFVVSERYAKVTRLFRIERERRLYFNETERFLRRSIYLPFNKIYLFKIYRSIIMIMFSYHN